jgi:hypothetical protein
MRLGPLAVDAVGYHPTVRQRNNRNVATVPVEGSERGRFEVHAAQGFFCHVMSYHVSKTQDQGKNSSFLQFAFAIMNTAEIHDGGSRRVHCPLSRDRIGLGRAGRGQGWAIFTVLVLLDDACFDPSTLHMCAKTPESHPALLKCRTLSPTPSARPQSCLYSVY